MHQNRAMPLETRSILRIRLVSDAIDGWRRANIIMPQTIPRKRVNVLGVGLSVLNLGLARQEITAALEQKSKGYICVTGVHGVMEAQKDPGFRSILNLAFLNTPD